MASRTRSCRREFEWKNSVAYKIQQYAGVKESCVHSSGLRKLVRGQGFLSPATTDRSRSNRHTKLLIGSLEEYVPGWHMATLLLGRQSWAPRSGISTKHSLWHIVMSQMSPKKRPAASPARFSNSPLCEDCSSGRPLMEHITRFLLHLT